MDDFVINWTKELGWKENPFKKILLPTEKFLGGYDKERERLNLFILNESAFGTIHATDGMGKTTLLLWLLDNLRRHYDKFDITLADKNSIGSEQAFINKLCEPYIQRNKMKTAFASIFRKAQKITSKTIGAYLKEGLKDKRLVIIIDDAHLLTKEQSDILESIIGMPKVSLILAGNFPSKTKHKPLGKDELGLEIKKIDYASGREMLKKRIEYVDGTDIWPFTDKLLKDIFGLGDYNPKKILTLCQEKAKELAIEVKMGKIKKPEKRLFSIEHEITIADKKAEHPHVEQKKKDGLVFKFTVKDDESEEKNETVDLRKEEERQTEEPEKKDSKENRKKEEKKDEKLDQPIIIDLGYDKPKDTSEEKKKSEQIEIDISPRKKKKS
ncbi:MAG: AAA family ATPase [Nanoarchaeota archaeon]